MGSRSTIMPTAAGRMMNRLVRRARDMLFFSSFAVQPENKNIFGVSSVTLTCRAGGGSGSYLYNWHDKDGNLLSDEVSYMTDQEGDYQCIVYDNMSLDTAESNWVQVYSEDLRPIITLQPSNVMLEYREEGEYSASFTCEAISPVTGDDSNLDYVWEIYDKAKGWNYAGLTYKRLSFSAVQPGTTCRCKVADRNTGEYVYSDAAMAIVKMKFVSWRGIGHDSSEYNTSTQEYSFVGGCAPYTVEIYAILPTMGELIQKRYKGKTDTTVVTIVPYSFYDLESTPDGVTLSWIEPTYYAVATDSLGQTCKSGTVSPKSGANWFGTGRTTP